MKIYKYELVPDSDGFIRVDLPLGAKVIFASQDPQNKPSIWAEVDTQRPNQERWFHVVPTGGDVPTSVAALEYVGSWVHGPLVWHLYEDWAALGQS